MDRRTLTIILALGLIISFFLKFVGGGSAMDVVKSSFLGAEKYVLLVIPVCGALLLLGALNNGQYPLGRNTLCWLSLLALLFWIIGMPLINHVPLDKIFNGFTRNAGPGFWLAAVSSIGLVFYNPRS